MPISIRDLLNMTVEEARYDLCVDEDNIDCDNGGIHRITQMSVFDYNDGDLVDDFDGLFI